MSQSNEGRSSLQILSMMLCIVPFTGIPAIGMECWRLRSVDGSHRFIYDATFGLFAVGWIAFATSWKFLVDDWLVNRLTGNSKLNRLLGVRPYHVYNVHE